VLLPALIMAGGKGTRLNSSLEKPLLRVKGRPMISYVIEALRHAECVEKVVVVASKHTPNTYKVVRRLGTEALLAPGRGYVEDLHYAVKALRLKGAVLVTACDLPLVRSALIDQIIRYYYTYCRKPALTVAVPYEVHKALGLRPSYLFEIGGLKAAPSGVNILDTSMIGREYIDEDVMVLSSLELAVNVNTLEDLQLAEKLIDDGGLRP